MEKSWSERRQPSLGCRPPSAGQDTRIVKGRVRWTMHLLVVWCLLAGVLGEKEGGPTTPMAPGKPQQPPSQHLSSLKNSVDQKNADEQAQPQQPGGAAGGDEYRQLNADEVKQLLLKVVDENIDLDKDEHVTAEELRGWLGALQERVIEDNVARQWAYYSPPPEEVLSWEAYYPEQKRAVSWQRYLNFTYPDEALREGGNGSSPEMREVRELMRRAERRWKNADADGDGALSRSELRDFIHPEESQRAGAVAVQEAVEDMDVDKDGRISLHEYMQHLRKVSGEEQEDPNWAPAQEGHFSSFLDKDKDGSLDLDEMREWVVPSYDRSEAEAWRLISIADQDQDQKLSKKEIEEYHEYFLTLLPPEYWVHDDQAQFTAHDEF